MSPGRLFIVATPIGNLEDISARAKTVLASVDVIAAEDTRHSRKLLGHYNISTPITSYHEYNETEKTVELLKKVNDGGDIALITDAGTPCISDPGYRLVHGARQAGIEVVAVPGPSAVTAALSISGLPTDKFVFHGFFPRKRRDADRLLELAEEWAPATHVFFEAPNRVIATLMILAERFPSDRACIAREITKMFEEVISGVPAELLERFSARDVKGECVLMIHIAAPTTSAKPTTEELRTRARDLMMEQNMSRRDVARHLANEFQMPRRYVYEAIIEREE